MKGRRLTIQMKAFEQYFHVVLFCIACKVVLTLESVDERHVCDHSNESYWAILSCVVLFVMLCFYIFSLCLKLCLVTFNGNLFSINLIWWCLSFSIQWKNPVQLSIKIVIYCKTRLETLAQSFAPFPLTSPSVISFFPKEGRDLIKTFLYYPLFLKKWLSRHAPARSLYLSHSEVACGFQFV